ncbi:hypothetical protein K0M31_010836 [Melipona bicolor]|uniref:Uncharacterized protein n=1 Tax=Melipona bicolor TaxID=60889 RepID=A0AA40FKY8_9HYME|nr:hypothetical protein K0M31_010836 [Melipona bicolor]
MRLPKPNKKTNRCLLPNFEGPAARVSSTYEARSKQQSEVLVGRERTEERPGTKLFEPENRNNPAEETAVTGRKSKQHKVPAFARGTFRLEREGRLCWWFIENEPCGTSYLDGIAVYRWPYCPLIPH